MLFVYLNIYLKKKNLKSKILLKLKNTVIKKINIELEQEVTHVFEFVDPSFNKKNPKLQVIQAIPSVLH